MKYLARYLRDPLDRETVSQKMKEMLEDPAIAQNATVQLMAATIFAKEGEMVEAMRCCATGLSLELSAFMVNMLISMDRVDVAEKTLEDGGERRRRDFDAVGDGVGECRTRWVEGSRRDVRVSRVGR